MFTIVWHHPVTHGALTGLIAAAAVDYGAFRTWHNFHDFVSYDWGVAIFRWLQGAIAGALTAAGLFVIA